MNRYSTMATTIEEWLSNRGKNKTECKDCPVDSDNEDMGVDSDLQDEVDELDLEGMIENTHSHKKNRYRSLAEWRTAAVKFYDTKTDVEHLDGMTFSDWLNKHDCTPMRRTENGELVRRSIAFEV